MKFLLTISFVIIYCFSLFSQSPGEWIWLRGSPSTIFNAGSLGTQGVSSPLNDPRGVYEACEWTDTSGCFWLFGGMRMSSCYSDLYKYDPATNEWTWMKGPGTPDDSGSYGTMEIPSANNLPPARGYGVATWTDHENNLWMWGGGSFQGVYNDLWKYDISTNEWTWMNGTDTIYDPGNYGTQGVPTMLTRPGARSECTASWTDSNNNLWLFGGGSFANVYFNDLWKYDISTNQWTWMKGSSTANMPGVYGLQGVEDSSNTPGGRMAYTNWTDGNGNLWLFGGNSSQLNFQDMWKYNLSTNNWTWIRGGSAGNEPGNYVAACSTSLLNAPPCRMENRAEWTDKRGNFWTYGGNQYPLGLLGDLWMFCTSSQQWIFVGDKPGFHGSLGVSSPMNWPGARMGSNGWQGKNGKFYFYGGGDPTYSYNDVWVYAIDTTCGFCVTLPYANFSSENFLCPGSCVDFTNLSVNAATYAWSFPGAAPPFSTDANPSNICYTAEGSYDVQLIASNANGADTLLLQNYIVVNPAPPPQAITQIGDTLFAISGAASYQWYYNGSAINGATNYYHLADANGDYNLVALDSNGCEVEAAIFNVVTAVTPLSEGEGPGVKLYPNPATELLCVKGDGIKFESVVVYNVVGEIPIQHTYETNQNEVALDVSILPPGIYFVEVAEGKTVHRVKFVRE